MLYTCCYLLGAPDSVSVKRKYKCNELSEGAPCLCQRGHNTETSSETTHPSGSPALPQPRDVQTSNIGTLEWSLWVRNNRRAQQKLLCLGLLTTSAETSCTWSPPFKTQGVFLTAYSCNKNSSIAIKPGCAGMMLVEDKGECKLKKE